MSSDTETHEYEVVVVGGGPAGMTAALYSTRLGHKTAVVSRGGGRAAMMKEVHNVLRRNGGTQRHGVSPSWHRTAGELRL